MSSKKKYGIPCAGGCGKLGHFSYGKCRDCIRTYCSVEKCKKPFRGGKDGHSKCPSCRKLRGNGELFAIINSPIDR